MTPSAKEELQRAAKLVCCYEQLEARVVWMMEHGELSTRQFLILQDELDRLRSTVIRLTTDMKGLRDACTQ